MDLKTRPSTAPPPLCSVAVKALFRLRSGFVAGSRLRVPEDGNVNHICKPQHWMSDLNPVPGPSYSAGDSNSEESKWKQWQYVDISVRDEEGYNFIFK